MSPTIVGLGELLWDFLPSGKRLGGAPANFAHAAALLGNLSTIASRIGTDALGNEAISSLAIGSVSTNDLQFDSIHSTGGVKVSLDRSGQPQYEITQSVAWDFLQWTSAWEALARKADAVCFGSLAQRSPVARKTIQTFLKTMRPRATRVFDVNLRQLFYSEGIIRESIELANIVKLNDHELPIIADLLGIDGDGQEKIGRELLRAFNLELVCITRGEKGSVLLTNEETDVHPGFKVRVADTVGAGDAFAAGVVHQYLRQKSLRAINELANRMGAWISTQSGAMPSPVEGFRERMNIE